MVPTLRGVYTTDGANPPALVIHDFCDGQSCLSTGWLGGQSSVVSVSREVNNEKKMVGEGERVERRGFYWVVNKQGLLM